MKKFFIILFAAALVVAFSMPATAATSLKIVGGQVVRTMVTNTDMAAVGTRDTSPLTWTEKSDPTARINISATVDDLVGFSATMNFKQAGARSGGVYGYYNMGFGRLKVGDDLLPTFWAGFPGPDVGDRVGGTGGDLGSPGLHMDRIKIGPLGAAVALTNPTTNTSGAFDVQEATMPRLTGNLSYKGGPFGVTLAGGYVSNDVYTTDTTTAIKRDVSGTYVGLYVSYRIGAAGFDANVYKFTNPNFYGGPPPSAAGRAYFNGANALIDSEKFGWGLKFSYKITPMFEFQCGYGEEELEVPNAGTPANIDKDPRKAYWLEFPITVHKNFKIRPGFSKLDNEYILINANSTAENEVTKYGATWEITF